jgi:alkylation response protein AidB-like acyl-CoA dehydrogenase
MEFSLTTQQQRVFDLVGTLGRERFFPRAARYDQLVETPLANLRDLFEAGLLGMTIRRDLGGMGGGIAGEDPLLYLLAIEQTARYCLSTAHSLHIHCHGAHLVDQLGTRAQRERILLPVLERGSLLNATGSEPGRTARGQYMLFTAADRADHGYLITGRKNYASLADAVDYNIIFASIRDLAPVEGHIGLMIPRGAQGLTIEDGSWNPLGMRGAVSPNLRLENCYVGDENVLGQPGQYIRERWQAKFHLSFAAQYLGGAESVFDYLVEYLPRRGTAMDHYAQLRLGEIRIGIDSVRRLLYYAAWCWTQGDGQRAELASLIAKHRAIENAVMVMDRGAQIAGSSAFMADSALPRIYRDLRMQTLHENLDQTAATIGKFHLGQEFDTTARL